MLYTYEVSILVRLIFCLLFRITNTFHSHANLYSGIHAYIQTQRPNTTKPPILSPMQCAMLLAKSDFMRSVACNVNRLFAECRFLAIECSNSYSLAVINISKCIHINWCISQHTILYDGHWTLIVLWPVNNVTVFSLLVWLFVVSVIKLKLHMNCFLCVGNQGKRERNTHRHSKRKNKRPN